MIFNFGIPLPLNNNIGVFQFGGDYAFGSPPPAAPPGGFGVGGSLREQIIICGNSTKNTRIGLNASIDKSKCDCM